MKQLTLQIKPVGNHCNICCSYCYAKPFKSKNFSLLSLELLDKIVKEAFELCNNVVISWHGGEPTMAGLDFFKNYVKIVNKYKGENQTITNMIQTNAILINDDFAEFFKNNNFVVSVSLDGDEQSHNKNRYDYLKKGSFSRTMQGVNTLRRYDINPPVIVTVSQSTYKDGIKNFEFLVENGFKEIKYSPVYDSANDNFSVSDDMWFEYLKDIFYKWLSLQRKDIIVREIDEILMWMAQKKPNLCSSMGMCRN